MYREQPMTSTEISPTNDNVNNNNNHVNSYDTLLERFYKNVQKNPNKLAISFCNRSNIQQPQQLQQKTSSSLNHINIENQVTYRELDEITNLLAHSLVEKYHVQPGDRIVLVYPPSLDFMVSFITCCKINVIAVPVFPPNPNKRDSIHMFCHIVKECNASISLTNQSYNYMKQLTSIKDFFSNGTKLKKQSIAWPDNIKWIVTDTEISTQRIKVKSTTIPSLSSIISKQKPNANSMKPPDDDICFLQFTSGSTSDPKGVMITHNNLKHNLTIITKELQASSDTIVVSWLPQYHDMGLIGSYLGILYCNGTGYYMSPLTFLSNSSFWIECISHFKATHLQAPNFAFKLTSRKFDATKYYYPNSNDTQNRIPIDLSSVRHIINAAEPVDEESMQLFYKTFVPYGLSPSVIYPTYGLAEHTVFVCSGGKQILSVEKDALEKDGIVNIINDDSNVNMSRLAGCGYPSNHNIDVQIVKSIVTNDQQQDLELINDDENIKYQACDEDIVGEIWISSPSKAAGYYQKDVETRRDFYATLYGIDNRYYLRTGDLGFMHQKELFICGRQKDLIIIAGRNYYPQDIEGTAEFTLTDQIIRYGCSAAFTITQAATNPENGNDANSSNTSEDVILVMELRNEIISSNNKDISTLCTNYANQIRSSISQEHSLAISTIVFVNQRTTPKTSSGKIARAWCRKAYINRTLQIVYEKSFKQQDTETMKPFEMENGNSDNIASSSNIIDKSAAIKQKLSAEQIRALSKNAISRMLETDISQVSSLPISCIDKNTALASMMDSLTISQFKGMFEINYYINPSLSDDYLLRDSTSVTKLTEIVKLGYAPDDNAGGDVENQHHHHSSGVGGLAGAMGCPPGVVCVIL